MRLQIASPHVELTSPLRQFIEERFQRLPHPFDRGASVLRVDIETPVGETKTRFLECRLRLTVPGGLLVVSKRGRDVYTAVAAAERALHRVIEEWTDRVLTGSRWPKKFFIARRMEDEEAPVLLSEKEAVLVENEGGAEEEADRSPPALRSARELLSTLAARRSVRRFLSAPIPDSALSDLSDALVLAPTAGNLESRRFFLVRDAALRAGLSAAASGQEFALDAPLLVVACAHLGSASVYRRRGVELYAPMEVAASIENLLIVAQTLGLGTTWIGEFDEHEVSRRLGLVPELRPLAIIAVGWPAEQPPPPERLPRNEVVHQV